MKRFTVLVLSLVLIASLSVTAFATSPEASDFGAYKSVVIIGVDGAGAFFDDADTPSCDRIFSENSAVTNNAKAETVTISAQNWGSILLGVSYLKHGLTNSTLETVERSSDAKYPSVFRLAREHNPEAVLASFCNWNPINFGLIENDIGVYKDTANDAELCDKIVDYLGANNPELLFVQFDSVDGAGHRNGYGSDAHLSALSTVDGYIGRIYDAIQEKAIADDTLFIVVSDHGGTRGIFSEGGSHGGVTSTEITVFVGVRGKTVNDCAMSNVRNRDVAAIALYALGIEKGADMTSRIPLGLFDGEQANAGDFVSRIWAFFNNVISKIFELFACFGVAC